MRSVKNIAWLAGLVEGEGAFVYNHASLVMTINSTDFDVIDKAARILDAPVRGPYKQRGYGSKPIYRITVYGAEWPLTLFSFLGERRRTRIKELLVPWRDSGRPKRRRRVGYNGVFDRIAQEPRDSQNSEQAEGCWN